MLIALHKADTPFEPRALDDPAAVAEWKARWPLARMPLLVDGDEVVPEASIIIEWLDRHRPGPAPMLPADLDERLEARLLDRFFDNYVQAPMQAIVADCMRAPDRRDPDAVAQAHALLDSALGWLDARMEGRSWAVGTSFGIADCAAAPSLFYADWVHRFTDRLPNVAAYRARLLARPAVARCVEAARPYRWMFPPGAPDRD